jgi:hypothetical protein
MFTSTLMSRTHVVTQCGAIWEQEMNVIIAEARSDPAKISVRCRVQLRQLSFYDFLLTFDRLDELHYVTILHYTTLIQ